jgi:hypothetical protein
MGFASTDEFDSYESVEPVTGRIEKACVNAITVILVAVFLMCVGVLCSVEYLFRAFLRLPSYGGVDIRFDRT